jgi:hypothetical protein
MTWNNEGGLIGTKVYKGNFKDDKIGNGKGLLT